MDVDEQCSSLIWTSYQHQQSLLSARWELEMSVLSAKEELSWSECELLRLNNILNWTVKERDELKLKYQILLQQQQQLLLLEKHNNNVATTSTSSGNSEESESNTTSSISTTAEEEVRLLPEAVKELIGDKPLPEKGRLLKAVMEAGPLLETFLISGPLPQWDHPPPNLNFIDIPLVSISINTTNHTDQDQPLIDSHLPTKYQKTQH